MFAAVISATLLNNSEADANILFGFIDSSDRAVLTDCAGHAGKDGYSFRSDGAGGDVELKCDRCTDHSEFRSLSDCCGCPDHGGFPGQRRVKFAARRGLGADSAGPGRCWLGTQGLQRCDGCQMGCRRKLAGRETVACFADLSFAETALPFTCLVAVEFDHLHGFCRM